MLSSRPDGLPAAAPTPDTPAIRAAEEDGSPLITLSLPELGTVTLSEETLRANPRAAVITLRSPYQLRSMQEDHDGTTLIIRAAKTSLLGNRTRPGQDTSITLEFFDLTRIVYAPETGEEIILWEK